MGRTIIAVLVLLGTAAPAIPARAATAPGPVVAVAPTCVQPGVATRIVIIGANWANGPVTLTQTGSPSAIGTATARTSPVRQQPGSFSFTTTITATSSFVITAAQGRVARPAAVAVQSGCPLQVSVKPPCLSGPGTVQLTGSGFSPGSQVQIDVDPFGNAEAVPQTTVVSSSGGIATVLAVPFGGAPVPIVATQPAIFGTSVGFPTRAVAFVDPCPPPTTNTTATTTRPDPGTTATTTSTTVLSTTTSTTTATTTPVPPAVPPVGIPGVKAQATISPTTVRPGRCAVISISQAPPGVAVVARFADGPAVTGQTDPSGRAVLSVCVPFDSGSPLGSVKVLIGIGPGASVPVFDELRVPRRPEPPLLQSGADARRS